MGVGGTILTWLKIAGKIVAEASGILQVAGPTITQLVPSSGGVIQTISKDLAEIQTAVVSAEAFGQMQGLTGAQKAQAVAPMVAQIIMASALVSGKALRAGQQQEIMGAAADIGGGVARFLNCFEPAVSQSLPGASVSPPVAPPA